MSNINRENRINLAINAIQTKPELSTRRAAKYYGLSESTIRHRMNGRTAKVNTRNVNLNLTETEEEAIKRDGRPVGKRWTERFVNRRTELKT
ncbi:hypothetical protein K456DRAFT_1718012 [Colletotrichum gloeosporioides 23]|nr:hypothetical protein K456DRAFT_1718012 [Colletotrichum gloeosporioides 23]